MYSSNQNSESNWPEWILGAGPTVANDLDYILQLRAKLHASEKDGYVYRYVMHERRLQYQDALVSQGVIDPATGIIRKHVKLPDEFVRLMVYEQGAPVRLFRQLLHARKMALLHLLDGTEYGVRSGNLIMTAMCLRSIIEHVAQFYDAVTEVGNIDEPSDASGIVEINTELTTKLAKRLFPTRLDWLKVTKDDISTTLSKRSRYEYKPTEDRLDQSAEQIMNSIDRLTKKIKRLRGAYEILCEFAHPNFGILLAVVQDGDVTVDKQGIPWVSKTLSLSPPAVLLKTYGNVFSEVIKKVVECLREFDSLVESSAEQEAKIQRICQLSVRASLDVNDHLFERYEPCPCASGDKLKFCCGSSAKRS